MRWSKYTRYTTKRQTVKARIRTLSIVAILLTSCLLSGRPALTQGASPPPQPASLVYDEMRTVYLGNLARRDNGVPPLRWNAQMTDAARWFSWDSVENRPLAGKLCR